MWVRLIVKTQDSIHTEGPKDVFVLEVSRTVCAEKAASAVRVSSLFLCVSSGTFPRL